MERGKKKMTTERGRTRTKKHRTNQLRMQGPGTGGRKGSGGKRGTARVGTCGAIPASPVVSDDPVSVNTHR
jgi:hypothetical protein